MRTLIANIHAKIVDISPRAIVQVDDGVVSLGNLEGSLKSNKTTRQNMADSIVKAYDVKEVVYETPVKAKKDHINPFYNLD
jgi:phosphosulfolactate synthase (CoM biosynthesis protein A)